MNSTFPTLPSRKGFYFVGPDKDYPEKHWEAWTQGETTEARYWFPCIDHPRVKFSSEISVIVPIGFTAISNGILLNVEKQNNSKQIYRWSEINPHPAYLTSVVVGEYMEIKDGKNLCTMSRRKKSKTRPDHLNIRLKLSGSLKNT